MPGRGPVPRSLELVVVPVVVKRLIIAVASRSMSLQGCGLDLGTGQLVMQMER